MIYFLQQVTNNLTMYTYIESILKLTFQAILSKDEGKPSTFIHLYKNTNINTHISHNGLYIWLFPPNFFFSIQVSHLCNGFYEVQQSINSLVSNFQGCFYFAPIHCRSHICAILYIFVFGIPISSEGGGGEFLLALSLVSSYLRKRVTKRA